MNNISNITIKLSDNPEVGEEPFCIAKGDFINYKKNNRVEKYLIFSSVFQPNCFKEVSELFIDGTFKIAPKNWYQLVNIIGFIEDKKIFNLWFLFF